MIIKITNKALDNYGKEYETVYKDGDGYYIQVIETLIYVNEKDYEVVNYVKK